mmetsp:Transcript_120727/g.341406  ORF Transcript_120727/g.341406 Transcript_120727/m.341406 type:complete len:242 (-) Transcript_120727:738-1463(-)
MPTTVGRTLVGRIGQIRRDRSRVEDDVIRLRASHAWGATTTSWRQIGTVPAHASIRVLQGVSHAFTVFGRLDNRKAAKTAATFRILQWCDVGVIWRCHLRPISAWNAVTTRIIPQAVGKRSVWCIVASNRARPICRMKFEALVTRIVAWKVPEIAPSQTTVVPGRFVAARPIWPHTARWLLAVRVSASLGAGPIVPVGLIAAYVAMTTKRRISLEGVSRIAFVGEQVLLSGHFALDFLNTN